MTKKSLKVSEEEEYHSDSDERYDTDQNEFDTLEGRYENTRSLYQEEYQTKMLLPIKTNEGLELCYTHVTDAPTDSDVEELEESEHEEDELQYNPPPRLLEEDQQPIDASVPITMAKLYAKREETLQQYKFRIGLLSSTLLENPEQKIGNVSALLEMMDEKQPEVKLTIEKLVMISLMEIFKDLLPAYQIKHQDAPSRKLKKVTQQLEGYEKQLVKGYESFLSRLENTAECLKKKSKNQKPDSRDKNLGKLAVKCLCELLLERPYFNFAENIVRLLTVYLDNPDESVRKMVDDCFRRIFHDDKRGFISLTIVRRINHLVKARAHSVHYEVLAVLLSLRIKNVNLDQEREDEIQNKKLQNKKSRVLSLSKRERKRKKELEKLENEMLEASAEENRKNKEQHLTEIVKTLFLIYFRILKRAPRSNLLSVTLEGLAKFAHCISLEYYHDLINVFDHLLEKESLNVREQLHCIKTVFVVLSGQGDVLNIDPLHFYTHLYRVMLNVHAGKTSENTDLLMSALEAVLINKRRKMTTPRMLSFTKRLATLALQLIHNGSLGSLCILRSVLQLTKTTDLLLDVESTYGQGVYNAEMSEPEYCNAGSTALWELCALRRHYHPVVRTMGDHISKGAPATGQGCLPPDLAKMNCMDFFRNYDPSQVAFNPSIPPPRKKKTV